MLLEEKVNSRIDAGGVSVKIVDYRWRRGVEIVEDEPHHVLCRRAKPSPLGVSAVIGKQHLPFGQLIFFPADVSIRTEAAANDEYVQSITCSLDRDWFADVVDIRATWDSGELARACDLRNSRIDQAVQWMGNEVASPGLASGILIESLGSVIAVELARHFRYSRGGLRIRTRDGKLLPSHLTRITDFIEAASQRCPTIEEIAAACNVSAAHLRRSFKTTTGHTIHHYIEGVRLAKASELLAETDLPLKEIAFRMGFASSSTFSSAFRKLQGEAPSEFRLKMRCSSVPLNGRS